MTCDAGAYGYYGSKVADYLDSYNKDTRMCSYANGCLFLNVYVFGDFHEKYFVPFLNGYKFKPSSIVSIANAPECAGQLASCLLKHLCGDEVVYSKCVECYAFSPDTTISNRAVSTNAEISIDVSLCEYLNILMSPSEIESIGIDISADMSMKASEYFKLIEGKKIVQLRTITKEELDKIDCNNAHPIEEFRVFPNPTSKYLYIMPNNIAYNDKANIKLINSLGVEVLSESINLINNEITTLNIADLTSGHYVVLIISTNSFFQKSIIKN